jgi:transcriptional regulator of NAD metabolism
MGQRSMVKNAQCVIRKDTNSIREHRSTESMLDTKEIIVKDVGLYQNTNVN